MRGLGTGSTRLLVAGLELRAAGAHRVIIADEVEYGLEPHRPIRFVDSLGAKNVPPRFQAFLTTHSPVAVQELDGRQLFVLRKNGEAHVVNPVGTDNLARVS
jgi:predicted ATP-dependent endonuclease of OLD family